MHSADRWLEVLEPVIERYRREGARQRFRGDAAFAKPELYEFLEARGVGYAIRLPSNGILEGHIDHLLKRPEGELPARPIVRYHEFTYRAGSWDRPRRVVAKVEWYRGELLPRWGFIVTNLSYPTVGIVRFYNGRGTAEMCQPYNLRTTL